MIKFDPFWTDLIQKNQSITAIFILSVNVTNFCSNIFRLVRNPIWSSLIHFGQIWSKKIKNKTVIFIISVNVTTFYSNIFRLVSKSNLIKFDQVWSILERSDPKKSKTKKTILILSVNVTTFYSSIFRLVRNPLWLSLIQFGQIWSKDQKQNSHFYPLCKCDKFLDCWGNPIWSSLIKFDPFWTDLIQKNQKQNSHFYPFCKCDNFL